MAYINYRKNNPSYSPGLSVYGKQDITESSEKGPKGDNGTSIYYINSTIGDGTYEINTLIKENIPFDSGDTSQTISYRAGDLVIDDSGSVYSIINGSDGLEISEKLGDISANLRRYWYQNSNGIVLMHTSTIGIKFDFITTTGEVIYGIEASGAVIKVTDKKWIYKNKEIQFIQERDDKGNILIFDLPSINNNG